MSEVKRIGVLTSGGDAPGMNAAIRAVVRGGIHKNLEVVGVMRGYNGLITNELQEMNIRSVSEILHRGGTVLHTARCLEFKTPEGLKTAVANCRTNGIDGLVAIGGDGTFAGALELSKLGMPCVGVPCTIDNDIGCSEYTIGFDTAMNTAMEMIDRLRDTAHSHDRCSVVEVMGRRSGFLALDTGIACGALAILVPEIEYDIEHDVIDRMLYTQSIGKKHFIVIVAEGAGSAVEISKYIQYRTGITSRATVLGHVQRGGSPTIKDRISASTMGYRAVELLSQGIGSRVVVERDGKIIDLDMQEGLGLTKTIDSELLGMSRHISI